MTVPSRLFLSLLSLTLCLSLRPAAAAAATGTQQATAPTRVFPYLRAKGPLETVYEMETQHCPDYMPSGIPDDFPDSMPIAWAPPAGKVDPSIASMLISAAPYGIHPLIGRALGNVTHVCDRLVFNSSFDSDPSHYAFQGWLQSVTVLDNGDVVGLVHQEHHGWETNPKNCTVTKDLGSYCNMWSTTLAISKDGGATFQHARPPPQHLVAASPYTYSADEPGFGYGAISSMLRGDDGAYYGLINVLSREEQSGGPCPFRTDEPLDPTAYRGWDGSAFSVRWGNPYIPGAPRGICQTLHFGSRNNTPFGSHSSMRRLVGLPGAQKGWPSFVHVSLDGSDPQLGSCHYTYSYEPDFARAITGWVSEPRAFDLGVKRWIHYGGEILYTSLLDESSPLLMADTGEGASYVLAGNDTLYMYFVLQRNIMRRQVYFSETPEPVPPTPPPAPLSCKTFAVVGAGNETVNGNYTLVPDKLSDGLPVFQKDAQLQLYRFEGTWRIAHDGEANTVWYVSLETNSTRPSPVIDNWRYSLGLAPSPESVLCAD